MVFCAIALYCYRYSRIPICRYSSNEEIDGWERRVAPKSWGVVCYIQ